MREISFLQVKDERLMKRAHKRICIVELSRVLYNLHKQSFFNVVVSLNLLESVVTKTWKS